MKDISEIRDINYENKHIVVNIHLRDRRVLIKGDSSTGKSLIVNKIKMQIDGAYSVEGLKNDYSQMEVFSYRNIPNKNGDNFKFYKLLESIKNKIIIIDNADLLLKDADIDYINNDWNNKYVIISRGITRLQIMPNSIGHIENTKLEDGRTKFTLVYDYNERHWGSIE